MKKWLSVMLALALLLGCCPVLPLQASAADVTFTYTVDGAAATITGIAAGTTLSGDLEIPSEVDGYPLAGRAGQ